MKRIYLIAYFILFGPFLMAKGDLVLSDEISWNQVNGLNTFDQAVFSKNSGELPIYHTIVELSSAQNASVELVNAVYESTKLTEDHQKIVDSEIVPKAFLRKASKDYSLAIEFLPFRKTSTGVERLVSFELELTFTNASQFKTPTLDYTSESVLSSGAFYKIEVSQDGVHKISKDLLGELGMSLDNLKIGNVRVFGLPGGMLPQTAGTRKYDDLVEVAVEVVDQNSNGDFDDSDYILFYGEGADSWTYDPEDEVYTFEKNFYTRSHYYFLTRDLGVSRKIPNYVSTGTPNNFSNSFDALYAHELEENFYLQSGRNWLGEIFQEGNAKSYDISMPNLTGEPVYFQTLVGGRTLANGATNKFEWKLDGQTFANIQTAKVTEGYDRLYLSSDIEKTTLDVSNPSFNLELSYSNPGGNDGIGWLDYFFLNGRRNLSFENSALNSGQLIWSDKESLGEGFNTEFSLSNAADITLWDVTNIDGIQRVQLDSGGKFNIASHELKKFVAFNNQNHFVPIAIGAIENQNLHKEEFFDYLIITTADLVNEAERLADFHRQNGLTVRVTDVAQIYQEFASGAKDISAIRDYIKMFYDRADGDENLAPKYLGLAGDASYDYKNIHIAPEANSNMVPTYESPESFDSRFTYCTDDYFAFLDDGEGGDVTESSSGLDIAIGRFPVRTANEFKGMIDKIIHYKSTESKGQWLNQLTFIADDEDGNLHLDDTEDHINYVESNYPEYNIDKIYFDAFQQVPTANGNTFPDVNTALNNKIFSGSFLMNYVGHGSENAWAHEGVLDIPTIKSWSNKDKLPLFITATCSFSRFDDPKITSAGEELVLNPNGGAIAIVTTVRLVYTNANKQMNLGFLKFLFEKDDSGKPMAVGEIMRRAKNSISQSENNRKFALLGDPAMVLNYPQYNVVTTAINNNPVGAAATDTLKALSKVTIAGEVRNGDELMADFNGTLTPVVFDKLLNFKTLGQDEKSEVEDFSLRKSLVFKGLTSVENGSFEFSFVVPRDIAYQIGPGKLSYYAQDGLKDANGFNTDLLIGGVDENPDPDDQGPLIEVFMNDEGFVFGGSTDNNPVVLLKLSDESGINTTGTGVGHDVSIRLDGDDGEEIVVNDYYRAAENDYQKGAVSFPLFDLEEGAHSILARAWDTYNNPGEGYTEFVVAESAEMALNNLLNYPNPFTDLTTFWFEHNRVGQDLRVNIQIFTSGGRLIKTITTEVLSAQSRIDDIQWDGRDDYGNYIGRGVYIYRVSLSSENGQNSAHATEKLVILK